MCLTYDKKHDSESQSSPLISTFKLKKKLAKIYLLFGLFRDHIKHADVYWEHKFQSRQRKKCLFEELNRSFAQLRYWPI